MAQSNIAASKALQKAKANVDLPSIVLGCPEPDCDFKCTSNNQMCRHIFLTMHGLQKCNECDQLLVPWGFAPGVQKLFQQYKRNGVMVDDVRVTTADRHQASTGHNCSSYTKEDFILPGSPEDHGLAAKARPTKAEGGAKYRCPDCRRVIGTWVQMSRHIDSTKHCTVKCADCGLHLKCFGASTAARHERITGHRSFYGVYYTKEDLRVREGEEENAPRALETKQYRCPRTGRVFLDEFHFVEHMLNGEDGTSVDIGGYCKTCTEKPDEVKTGKKLVGRVSAKELLDHHREQYDHEIEFDQEVLNQYLVKMPPQLPVEEQVVSGDMRILYQCHECSAIFSSWTKLEKHLMRTKHTLAFCHECNNHMKPRPNATSDDHTVVFNHKDIFGEHKCKQDYEVFVDVKDAQMMALVDQPEKSPDDSFMRTVYQSPVVGSYRIFANETMLHQYMLESGEHMFTAPDGRKFDLTRDTQLLIKYIAENYQGREDELCGTTHHALCDFRVQISDRDLARYFPAMYVICPKCESAVERTALAAHQESSECSARRALKKRQKELKSDDGSQFAAAAAAAAAAPKPRQPSVVVGQTAAPAQFVAAPQVVPVTTAAPITTPPGSLTGAPPILAGGAGQAFNTSTPPGSLTGAPPILAGGPGQAFNTSTPPGSLTGAAPLLNAQFTTTTPPPAQPGSQPGSLTGATATLLASQLGAPQQPGSQQGSLSGQPLWPPQ